MSKAKCYFFEIGQDKTQTKQILNEIFIQKLKNRNLIGESFLKVFNKSVDIYKGK